MLLLTLAHRGEALEFIKRKFTQSTEFHFPGVYRSEHDLLVLTTEGVQNTTMRLSSVLTYFGQRIDRVINLGIAGGLDDKLQLNQVYGIREVYHEFTGDMEFPSFRCKETHSKLDCVTAVRRVLDQAYIEQLKKIAPIVDRELWAVGAVCDHFKLPFKSYKLISDRAGERTNQDEVKSRASFFSKHLFDFYKNLSLTQEEW